ncbi:hypothetical protein N9Z02_02900 [Akkermansiaceae bacterium]|nr:hypothetical protein [Akkermansiaceae bacterium]
MKFVIRSTRKIRMTLLVTTVGKDYALSCSDTRITIQSGGKYVPVDEKFNKNIVFRSNGLSANISYTGVARWTYKGKTIKLYDLISESLSKSATKNLGFGPLCHNLISDLSSKLNKKIPKDKNGKFIVELHIVGYHESIPIPFIGVISTFRTCSPWPTGGESNWEFEFPEMNLYFKVAESPEVIFGGMDTAMTRGEKSKLIKAASAGADAYNISKLSSLLIEKASSRNQAVGPRSVSVLLPKEGLLDTNLWDKFDDKVIAYLPRMVFSNGGIWGPSEFPANLNMISEGYLPRQSLFFKSLVDCQYRRKFKRRIFRRKKGLAIPGIMGILSLSLFGDIPDGYEDFGLDSG